MLNVVWLKCRIPTIVAAIALCTVVPAWIAPARAEALETRAKAVEVQFHDWLAQTVWPDAQKQGVSRETFARTFANVTLDWELPELQPPGQETPSDDQLQVEFQTPGRYFVEGQLVTLAKAGRCNWIREICDAAG